MREENTEPRYVISIAARMVGVQSYTLRYYEKIGVIEPRRSQGKIRLYSERDIALLRRVKSLLDDLGINLAGVEVILRLSDHVSQLQKKLAEAEAELEKYHQRDL
ncbi:MAG: MerR family transcriptional regulator [Chloroflexota bacterium]